MSAACLTEVCRGPAEQPAPGGQIKIHCRGDWLRKPFLLRKLISADTNDKNRYSRPMDCTLICCVLLIVAFGLVMLYSTGSYNGEVRFDDAGYYFKKQFFATSIGLFVMYLVANTDYHLWQRLAVPAYGLAVVLSTLVLFVGRSYNGSKRWLALGPLSFQPSEFAKLAVILFLAYVISRREKKPDLKFLMAVFLSILPIVGLVGTNNLSTAIIILGIGVIVIFVSYPAWFPFVCMVVAGGGFMALFLSVESYRLERLLIWRNPEQYEKGYQTLQGLYAIGSGGLFGKGLGGSMQKLGFVPEAQNDMIFSIICEELGLVGALILIAVFGIMLWRFLLIAQHSADLFGALIASGILGHIAIQIVLNIGVVTNTIPNTGITLPFISYGGTSVVFLLAEMGIAMNLSKCLPRSFGREKKKITHSEKRTTTA